MVRRAVRSSWARAASASGYRPPMRTFRRPSAEQVAGSLTELVEAGDVVPECRPGQEQGPAGVKPLRIEWRHRAAGRPVQDHVPARAQRLQAGVERRLPDPVVNDCRACSAGHLPDYRGEILVAGDMISPGRPGQLCLGVSGGGRDDDAASHPDHLGEQEAHPARGRVHDHRIALCHPVGAVAQVVGGHPLQHDGGSDLQAHPVGNSNGTVGRDENLLRGRAGRSGPGHAVARREAGYPRTDGRHCSRALHAGQVGHAAVVGRPALPLVDVHEVDSGRGHVDKQPARARAGSRPVADLKDVRAAVLPDHHCAHGAILTHCAPLGHPRVG